jgi:aryl-alcohol dehydrogenase-like predicted oxidoreductase
MRPSLHARLPTGAPRAARHRGAERILDVVARAGEGSLSGARRARDRLRALQPAGQGLSDRRDQREDDIRSYRLAKHRATLRAEARKANQVLVDLLNRIALREQATPAQIALAWILAQKPWIVPIPGTTKSHQLQGNVGAAAIELRPENPQNVRASRAYLHVHRS